MEQGVDRDWAIIGAGVLPSDAQLREKHVAQDCLSTLIALEASGTSAEVVGSMIDYVPVEDGNGALIRQLASPNIRIVSLTITGSGYYTDPATGGFDACHPHMQYDIAHSEQPRSAVGAIVAALRVRRSSGAGPITGLSCDNLDGNGDALRQAVVGLAGEQQPRLAAWIERHCTFPNSLVDCIVPVTGARELELARSHGVDDKLPVTHEAFRQWVIQDDFCCGRPDLARAGVTFSESVGAYMSMKMKVLNGGHLIIATIGEILSLGTISRCMANPLVCALLDKIMRTEMLPHIKPAAEVSLEDYYAVVRDRFSNPAMRDEVRRIAHRSSVRYPRFILPVLRERLATDAQMDGHALVQAFWARMCEGTRENGSTIEPNDPIWDTLKQSAAAARERPLRWLEQHDIYGDLADVPTFADRFEYWLDMIWSKGCNAALQVYRDN